MSVSIENIAGSTEKPTTIRAKLQHLKISTMRRIGLPSTRQSRTIEAASTGASVATSAKGNKCDHWIIGIFGVKGVGKTALMDRFLLRHLVTTYDPTLGIFDRRIAEVEGRQSILDFIDWSPSEYSALNDHYLNNAQGFVIVYSIYDRLSFDGCQNIYDGIRSLKSKLIVRNESKPSTLEGMTLDHSPVTLVGHAFVKDEELGEKRIREVSEEEGNALARELGCGYIEVCTSLDLNVEKVFFDIVRELRKQKAA